jgi:hypothetical protein
VKALLAALVAVAVVLGGAGGATLLLERRLAALAPGGVETDALHYNPFTGTLVLDGVRARGADGRERFRADRLEGLVSPLALLGGTVTLARARLSAPRLTLAGPEALLAPPPLRVEDLVITGGRVVVEGSGGTSPALRADDLDVQLERRAFALQTAMYGTLVRVTGQPRGEGYAVHLRARDVDVPALVRDLPAARLAGLRGGRGEVDVVLQRVGERLLAWGQLRVADVVVALPVRGQPRLRAATAMVVADGLDVLSGAGRIARVHVGAPSLSLPVVTAASTLASLLAPLRMPADLLVRRVAVTDGTLVLTGPGGVRLERLQLAAASPERRSTEAWALSARARLDRGADVALEGRLARDLRALDAAARLRRVGLGPWRALTGAGTDWNARVSFDGRLRVAAGAGEPAITLIGQAGLPDGEPVAVHESVSYQPSDGPGSALRALLTAVETALHTAGAGF